MSCLSAFDLDQCRPIIPLPFYQLPARKFCCGPEEGAMKSFTVPTALLTAVLLLPIAGHSLRADDAHHQAPGAPATQAPAQPNAPAVQGQTPPAPSTSAPTTGQGGPNQGQQQPGQPHGGMMANCPMMAGQTQQGGMNCPMMQGQSGGHGMMPGMGQPKSNSPH
jgi:hypothetical protein